jgi:lycopene beta-cyclase
MKLSCIILSAWIVGGGHAFVIPTSSSTIQKIFAWNPQLRQNIVSPCKKIASQSILFAENGEPNGNSYDDVCDVLVLGSGPAGSAIASILGADGDLDIVVADQNVDKDWVPNYGVWKDEWQTVLDRYKSAGIEIEGGNVGNSVDREWSVTDCYFGGSFDIPSEQRMRLDRPYCRVDRFALKKSLSKNFRVIKANHFSEAIGVNMYKPAGSLVHDEDGTTIKLQPKDSSTSIAVRAKIVVDTTGHETKLVMKDTRGQYTPPGFQIAYGATVEVDELNSPDLSHIGPYDKEAMTLFDYRTDHFSNEGDAQRAEKVPTFMYAMPLKGKEIFFEETSLVARPAVSFQDCKDRCFARLEHHGIKVKKVTEEEFCYIPMGGALPIRDQRIFGFGGAAAMVHPSTGFHICRAMMGASDAAQVIKSELSSSEPNVDKAVANAYHSLWSPDNIRQRNFAVFGGEFLMQKDVVGLRGFFDGFFKLPLELWGGFLAGWPGLAYNENHESWWRRMWFGLSFIVKIPLPVALDMASNILLYSFTDGIDLAQSVTPFFGEPYSYEYKRNTDRVGDVVSSFACMDDDSDGNSNLYIS